MSKLISILGSTGSIGLTPLQILDKKKKSFRPYLFSADKNYDLIVKQIKKYKPFYFLINNYKIYEKVKNKFSKNKITIINKLHINNIKKISDITIIAIPGIAGLAPTIEMIKKSKKILIANKESIICGWSLIKRFSIKYKTKIVPVDSEHFSISKLLENIQLKNIEKVYLTASGGPFLNLKLNKFRKIKPHHALKHPKWKMGKKISIDSSTLMNKILELIEAQKLFNIPGNKLDIVIHPNSLVHAIITLKNGLSKFIYHETSMIIPLANAIFDNKININDFYKKKIEPFVPNLNFSKVDKKKFPIINLKHKANLYPSTSIIINASNEILVDQFIKGKIPYLAISKVIMSILRDRNYKKNAIKRASNLNQIIKTDLWARKLTFKKIQKYV